MKTYPWRLPSPDQSVLHNSESALVITHRNDHPRTDSPKLAHDQNSSGRERVQSYTHTHLDCSRVCLYQPWSIIIAPHQDSFLDHRAKCQIHIPWLPKMLQGKPHGLSGNKPAADLSLPLVPSLLLRVPSPQPLGGGTLRDGTWNQVTFSHTMVVITSYILEQRE
jgi:hypothetical protein